MSILSQRIQNLTESATMKMAKLRRVLAEQGADVISLNLGEPDFYTPTFIKEAAIKAIKDNYSYYSPVAGYPELRKAIVAKLQRENNLEYTHDQIVVSTGAKQALANVILCLVNPGDEVIIPTPYWVTYSEQVKLAEGRCVFIPTKLSRNFKITPQELEGAITPKTKLFIFSSPSNPTGSVYTYEELAALAKIFEKYPQVYIISDEIYEHINFLGRHASIAEFSAIKNRVIIINGLSKAYAMTGWRLGYSASNKVIADACDKLQGQITSGTCSITQQAGIAAYQGGLETVHAMKQAFLRRRDLAYNLLKRINGLAVNLPAGAFYFFPDISAFFGKKTKEGGIIENAEDLSLYLLNIANVAVVGGDSFGSPNSMRISYAISDDLLEKAIYRIHEALSQLNA